MEHYARTEGSNEFFTMRDAYNASRKLISGDKSKAEKYLNHADLCIRSGGVSEQTKERINKLKKEFWFGYKSQISVSIAIGNKNEGRT